MFRRLSRKFKRTLSVCMILLISLTYLLAVPFTAHHIYADYTEKAEQVAQQYSRRLALRFERIASAAQIFAAKNPDFSSVSDYQLTENLRSLKSTNTDILGAVLVAPERRCGTLYYLIDTLLHGNFGKNPYETLQSVTSPAFRINNFYDGNYPDFRMFYILPLESRDYLLLVFDPVAMIEDLELENSPFIGSSDLMLAGGEKIISLKGAVDSGSGDYTRIMSDLPPKKLFSKEITLPLGDYGIELVYHVPLGTLYLQEAILFIVPLFLVAAIGAAGIALTNYFNMQTMKRLTRLAKKIENRSTEGERHVDNFDN